MKKDVRRTAAAMAAVLILGGQNPQILLAAGWEGADSLDRRRSRRLSMWRRAMLIHSMRIL